MEFQEKLLLRFPDLYMVAEMNKCESIPVKGFSASITEKNVQKRLKLRNKVNSKRCIINGEGTFVDDKNRKKKDFSPLI
jgi:hypothetical protein